MYLFCDNNPLWSTMVNKQRYLETVTIVRSFMYITQIKAALYAIYGIIRTHLDSSLV